MLVYGSIGLTEIVKTDNGWTRNVEFNRETVAVITGGGRGFHVRIRWKKYSMTGDVLLRIADLVSQLDKETGEKP
jgi:hypothetical protein